MTVLLVSGSEQNQRLWRFDRRQPMVRRTIARLGRLVRLGCRVPVVKLLELRGFEEDHLYMVVVWKHFTCLLLVV